VPDNSALWHHSEFDDFEASISAHELRIRLIAVTKSNEGFNG
jgi:hypothetical protein